MEVSSGLCRVTIPQISELFLPWSLLQLLSRVPSMLRGGAASRLKEAEKLGIRWEHRAT